MRFGAFPPYTSISSALTIDQASRSGFPSGYNDPAFGRRLQNNLPLEHCCRFYFPDVVSRLFSSASIIWLPGSSSVLCCVLLIIQMCLMFYHKHNSDTMPVPYHWNLWHQLCICNNTYKTGQVLPALHLTFFINSAYHRNRGISARKNCLPLTRSSRTTGRSRRTLHGQEKEEDRYLSQSL